jgi:hypothetical protein
LNSSRSIVGNCAKEYAACLGGRDELPLDQRHLRKELPECARQLAGCQADENNAGMGDSCFVSFYAGYQTPYLSKKGLTLSHLVNSKSVTVAEVFRKLLHQRIIVDIFPSPGTEHSSSLLMIGFDK